jgi:hypothetical protein
MIDCINRTAWAMRYVTKSWTTVFESMTTQLCIQDLASVEHRKVTRQNGCVVNQYRWKRAQDKEV